VLRPAPRKPRLRILFRVLVVACVLAAVGYLYVYVPRVPVPPLTGALSRETLRVGDRERTFAYYAPASLSPRPPLLIAFHGSGQTGESFRARTGYAFDRVADANGFVLAYPDGYEHHWNDCRKAASFSARALRDDDVGYVRALVAHLESKLGVDPGRVFATGHSNGGSMCYRIAQEMSGEIAGVAPISASMPVPENNDCQENGRAISVLDMNGTDDPIDPFDGGHETLFRFADRGYVRSSFDTARYFAKKSGLAETPVVERLQGDDASVWVERSTWGSPGARQVVLDAIHGGGHAVPQPYARYPRILGRTYQDFDGPAEIWRFFAQQPR
jgi:polyhydroxybutyrate depolymerase